MPRKPTSRPAVDRCTDRQHYAHQLGRIPQLTAAQEKDLARHYRDHQYHAAGQRIIVAHLPLAARIAYDHRGYQLPEMDLIGEANLALSYALQRFDPDRGTRFASYAHYWIQYHVRQYVLRNRKLTSFAKTRTVSRMFFRLPSALRELVGNTNATLNGNQLSTAQAQRLAERFSTTPEIIRDMYQQLYSPTLTLDQPADPQYGDETLGNIYVDENDNNDPAEQIIALDEHRHRTHVMHQAMATLEPREQDVLHHRRLTDHPERLEDLATRFGVSRETVRQQEQRAFRKLQKRAHALAVQPNVIRNCPAVGPRSHTPPPVLAHE